MRSSIGAVLVESTRSKRFSMWPQHRPSQTWHIQFEESPCTRTTDK